MWQDRGPRTLSLHLRPGLLPPREHMPRRRPLCFATSQPGATVGTRDSAGPACIPSTLICIWHHGHSSPHPGPDPQGLGPHDAASPDGSLTLKATKPGGGAGEPRGPPAAGSPGKPGEDGHIRTRGSSAVGAAVWGRPLCAELSEA